MLLHAIYGIPIQFTADNAGAFIQAAQFSLYEDAVSEGRLYLLRSLTITNSISAFLPAKNMGLTEVNKILFCRFSNQSWLRRTYSASEEHGRVCGPLSYPGLCGATSLVPFAG